MLLHLALRDLRAVDAGRQEARRLEGQRVVRGELVAGNLPLHEGVEGQILVEGLNDEVAVVVGGGPVIVVLETVTLGEAPRSSQWRAPALAVGGDARQPISTLGEALSEVSFRKASTCCGVGGRPIRSRYARRSNRRLSTRGLGAMPAASSFARMKRSMGVRTQPSFLTAGSSPFERLERPELPGSVGDRLAHPGCHLSFFQQWPVVGGAEVDPGRNVLDDCVGELAAALRHIRLFLVADKLIEQAGAPLPGRTAGPVLPPLSRPTRSTRSNSASVFLPPWQRRQDLISTGRTCFLNRSRPRAIFAAWSLSGGGATGLESAPRAAQPQQSRPARARSRRRMCSGEAWGGTMFSVTWGRMRRDSVGASVFRIEAQGKIGQ